MGSAVGYGKADLSTLLLGGRRWENRRCRPEAGAGAEAGASEGSAIANWSLKLDTKKRRKRPWHDDPGVLAETLDRVPITVGGLLGILAAAGFLIWFGIPAVVEAAGQADWGMVVWRLVECVLGVTFCSGTGFLVGKAFATLLLRVFLWSSDTRMVRSLEAAWERLRTQPPERRF